MNYTRLILEACKNSLNQADYFDVDDGEQMKVSNRFPKPTKDQLEAVFKVFGDFAYDFLNTFKKEYMNAGEEELTPKNVIEETTNHVKNLIKEFDRAETTFYQDISMDSLADYLELVLKIWEIPHKFDVVFIQVLFEQFQNTICKKLKGFDGIHEKNKIRDEIKEKIEELRNGKFIFTIK